MAVQVRDDEGLNDAEMGVWLDVKDLSGSLNDPVERTHRMRHQEFRFNS